MDRKAEIELKRQRIANLRKQRLQKRESEAPRPGPALKSVSTPEKPDIDELVDSLIGQGRKRASPDPSETSRESSFSDPPVVFGDVVITPVYDIPPKKPEKITYSKEVQTDAYFPEEKAEYEQVDVAAIESKIRLQLEEEYKVPSTEDERQPDSHDGKHVDSLGVVESVEDRDVEQLEKFLSQSFKVINRALDDDYDIMINYAEKQRGDNSLSPESDGLLSQSIQFKSPEEEHREITYLDWSAKFPELVAASYTEQMGDPYATKGLVKVWNMHSKVAPEYVFHGQSDVLAVKFSPFDANLVFGSAYNGQVMAWDLRSNSKDPILKSPLTGSGHTHPVYTLHITGTQNASSLITASTDGTVCTWSPDLLAKPQSKLILTNRTAAVSRIDDVAPTCLGVYPHDPSKLLFGTEEGALYRCNRYDQAGSKAGLDPAYKYTGHRAPITALDFHNSKGAVDFGDYVLSSSMDWSIKLWNVSNASNPALGPVLTFPRDDMVYDVSWHPTRPSMFGAVTGAGTLELWDLVHGADAPLYRAKPVHEDTKSASSSSLLNRPLNRMAWSQPDGSRVAVGGLDGVVTVYDAKIPTVTNDDWISMKKVLN
ncbi:hypothetical protein TRVA0_015S00452 [Trichomonascus vanleenenianus]|uniref:WD40 repeat domain-containing protein n=1 Tax=Trichomonascus vanleenenianus TaxID=2268995 RepID=UPI003EC977BB